LEVEKWRTSKIESSSRGLAENTSPWECELLDLAARRLLLCSVMFALHLLLNLDLSFALLNLQAFVF
jgi:hypothetical protein